ncbi:MAG: response regulator transcription factor [Alphaproteobacteria bacterium]
MIGASQIVFVVDDDADNRKALGRAIRAAGFKTCAFDSAEAFLTCHDPDVPGCVVLDLAMPGLGGLALQRELASSGCSRPIIFVTGRGDIAASVQALKAGAVDFLTKPVDIHALTDAVHRALKWDHHARAVMAERQAIGLRLASLTPREQQVLELVIKGKLNKQIAGDLGISEKTVKVHRSRVYEKLGVFSVAELVHLTERFSVSADATPVARSL